MIVLANGLYDAGHHEDAVSIYTANVSMRRRLGEPEENLDVVKGNIATTYQRLGRDEEVLSMRQEVYSGSLKLLGEEHFRTLSSAMNYASTLGALHRRTEAKALMRKWIPVAQRALGDSDGITIRMRSIYAQALYMGDGATLDDIREAVEMIEDSERIARRVFGGSHPLVAEIKRDLRRSRTALRAHESHETPPPRTFAPGWLDGPS